MGFCKGKKAVNARPLLESRKSIGGSFSGTITPHRIKLRMVALRPRRWEVLRRILNPVKP